MMGTVTSLCCWKIERESQGMQTFDFHDTLMCVPNRKKREDVELPLSLMVDEMFTEISPEDVDFHLTIDSPAHWTSKPQKFKNSRNALHRLTWIS